MMNSNDLYQKQLEYIFGRPVSDPLFSKNTLPPENERLPYLISFFLCLPQCLCCVFWHQTLY